MAVTLSLFESAMKRARIMRQGEIVQIVVDGGGAFVTTLQEFMPVQKWAQSRASTGNGISDRGRMFERISILISRPGSMVTTRGSEKYIEHLARLMNQAGYELSEWMLPPALKDITREHLKSAHQKKNSGDDTLIGDEDTEAAKPPDTPPPAD